MFTAEQIKDALALIADVEHHLGHSLDDGQRSDLLLDNFDWLNDSKESHEMLRIIARYNVVHRERLM